MNALTEPPRASNRRSLNPTGRSWMVLWVILVSGILIVRGAGPGADGEDVYLAICDGDLARLEKALARLPQVDARDHVGHTPLALAAGYGRRDAVEMLLAKGASVDAGHEQLGTPLMLALANGHGDVARLLLARGADVNARCAGFDPLLSAVRSDNQACVELVLEAGAEINQPGRRYNPLTFAVREHDAVVLRRLLKAGADPNTPDEEGTSPLCEAIERGSTCATRALLLAGADVSRGPNGFAPHDAAPMGGCCDAVEHVDRAHE